MDAYLLFNIVALIMSIGFCFFIKSKTGKKWLNEL